ncbi:MAG: 50S ribosomal protein L10 [Desulfobaccales bacterium]
MLKPQIEKKAKLVEELHEKAARARMTVLADFSGLKVEDLTRLRRQVREAEGELKVAKNTLLRRAATADTVLAPISDRITGPNAVALGFGDPVNLAKLLVKFAQDKPQFFKIKVGVLEGQVLSAAEVEALSKLPGREVLLAQLLGTLQSVPQGLVNVLAGVIRNLMNVLTALKEKKEGGEAGGESVEG